MYEANLYILQLPILMCISLIMVTITRHIFIKINIFQTERFPAVKFAMGYEKNVSFLLLNVKRVKWLYSSIE